MHQHPEAFVAGNIVTPNMLEMARNMNVLDSATASTPDGQVTVPDQGSTSSPHALCNIPVQVVAVSKLM